MNIIQKALHALGIIFDSSYFLLSFLVFFLGIFGGFGIDPIGAGGLFFGLLWIVITIAVVTFRASYLFTRPTVTAFTRYGYTFSIALPIVALAVAFTLGQS